MRTDCLVGLMVKVWAADLGFNSCLCGGIFSGVIALCARVVVVCFLFVGCLTSQQHASVSQGRICSDNFTCCHTEIEVADQTFHLTQ